MRALLKLKKTIFLIVLAITPIYSAEIPSTLDEVFLKVAPKQNLGQGITKQPGAFDWLPESDQRNSIIERIQSFPALDHLPVRDNQQNVGYSFSLSQAHVEFLESIRNFIATEGSPPRILDVGCGSGNMALCAHWAGAKVVALDPYNTPLAIQKFVSYLGKEKTSELMRSGQFVKTLVRD